jgi:hypothetical protein
MIASEINKEQDKSYGAISKIVIIVDWLC